MSSHHSPPPPWSDLHPDVFEEIARLLNLGDLPRVAAVCRKWHTSYSHYSRRGRPSLPWIEVPSSRRHHQDDSLRRRFYSLSEHRTYHLRLAPPSAHRILTSSPTGLLLTVDPTSADLHLVNPLTGAHSLLPPTSTLPTVAAVIRDPSGRVVSYLASHYTAVNPRELPTNYIKKYYLSKAAICPETGTVAVACEDSGQQLAFARAGDLSWTSLPPTDLVPRYCDLVFHRRKLIGLGYTGELVAFDPDRPSDAPHVLADEVAIVAEDRLWMSCHLVRSADGGCLFLVVRKYDDRQETVGFSVLKLDEGGGKWREVRRLEEDVAVFVGPRNVGSLMVEVGCDDGLMIRGNCVYFFEFPVDGGARGIIRRMDLRDRSFGTVKMDIPFEEFDHDPPIWFMPCLV